MTVKLDCESPSVWGGILADDAEGRNWDVARSVGSSAASTSAASDGWSRGAVGSDVPANKRERYVLILREGKDELPSPE